MTPRLFFHIQIRIQVQFTKPLARLSSRRRYSSSPSTIICSSIPAPHCGSIRVLQLNRPAARNAISRQLLAELSQEVKSIDAETTGETRALVLASAVDNVFCAGADLKERKTFTLEDTRSFLTSLRNTLTTISRLHIPTISAIHGAAYGGGLELGLSTSLRLVASSASIGLPETRLAILPGAGGTHRLTSLIGLGRARDLILTGRRVSGDEALRLGICERVADVQEGSSGARERERTLELALDWARDICQGGPVGVRQALRAVNAWEDGGETEANAYEVVLGTEDRIEALKAFAEKRKPAFKGR